MKAMLDRMADTINCQLLAGKYGCSTATAGSPASDEEATDYLNKILMGFGANLVGQVGASPGHDGSCGERGLLPGAIAGRSHLEVLFSTRRLPPFLEALARDD
jgi:hypothetical protein